MRELYAPAMDGEYTGRWSGHQLVVDYFGDRIEMVTERGIRGMNVPVRVKVVEGAIDEESITPCDTFKSKPIEDE